MEENNETDIQWIKASLNRIEARLERSEDSRDDRCELNEGKLNRLQRFQWQIIGALIVIEMALTLAVHIVKV